jgi:glucose/arabinose dehydrogenase
VALAKVGGSKVKTTGRLTVLAIGMAVATLTAALAGSVTPVHSAPVLPEGFTNSPVVSGLTNPTDMEFAPDGRLFITEDTGRVRIAKPDGTPLTTFLDISSKVDPLGERGLLALTFDPGFSTNHYVYLHYTRKATSTTPPHNRVVRVTASGDRAVAGSEQLIFRLGNQSAANEFPQFMGGALDFKNGKLYVATGDNDTPNKAQQLTNLFGKMLRINKDGTIPTNNPFYTTALGNNRAIWALGLRNPFKFAIQPGTGTIFVNDVGENTWEEINQLQKGANYGWPVHEGPESVSNYTPPIFAYEHSGDPATTGCAITGGTFYNPTTLQFPPGYEGDYFFADFCGGWIRRLEQNPDTASGFTASSFATGLERPIDLEVSQAGELYYLARGNMGSPAIVGKIGYADNQTP